ncbi:MAG: hypothetical protein QGF74_02730 [Candidatus Nanoarchaeia archaeon]|jgi:lipoate-protein ligase B|nr:hypothetical protein [Candidatus Nanoarchaeia archaeon]
MNLENRLDVIDLGNISYEESWERQKKELQRRIDGETSDTLILVEHPPTITFGISNNGWNKLKVDKAELSKYNIDFHEKTERGGGAAFLGPGQIVGYTIMKWRRPSIRELMISFEEVMIRTAKDFNILITRVDTMNPKTDKPYRATWYNQDGKYKVLCTKGIGTETRGEWIYTHHGFALNVNNSHNIPYTELIDPCGFPVSKTPPISMQTILGRELVLQEVKDKLVYRFAEVFNKKEVDYHGI